MLTEIQEQWLQALESGKYPQGRSRLFDGSGYCCLGVFCAIQPDVTLCVGEWEFKYKHTKMVHYLDNVELCSRLGLRSHAGSFLGGSLATMNDRGKTFKEIAEFIRANPEKVFKNVDSNTGTVASST